MINKYQDFIKENVNKDDTVVNSKYNSMIDFTYLKDDATLEKIKETCDIAQENNYYAVCVHMGYVSDVYGFLENDDIKIVTVVNYPDGDNKSNENIKDVTEAISDGVDEIDFVLDYKELKKAFILQNMLNSNIRDKELTKEEIKKEQEDIEIKFEKIENKVKDVSDICHRNGVQLKVIIESGELTLEEIKKACEISVRGGADYIMTSTGTKEKGAELDKVIYMKKILPDYVKLKVSGGIRTIQDVEKYYQYVDRIGTSSILKDIK